MMVRSKASLKEYVRNFNLWALLLFSHSAHWFNCSGANFDSQLSFQQQYKLCIKMFSDTGRALKDNTAVDSQLDMSRMTGCTKNFIKCPFLSVFSLRIMCSVRRDLLGKSEIFKQRVQSSDASWESCSLSTLTTTSPAPPTVGRLPDAQPLAPKALKSLPRLSRCSRTHYAPPYW